MKLLIITGPLWPRVGNNAILVSKLLPFLAERHEIKILSLAINVPESSLPETVFGFQAYWATGLHNDWKRRFLYPAISRLKQEPGFEGELGAKLLEDAAREIKKTYPYEAVLCTMQPYAGTIAASRLSGVPKLVYLMDPPDFVFDSLPWEAGQKQLPAALDRFDTVFTTPFILEALKETAKKALFQKCVAVSFPHIEQNDIVPTEQDIPMPPDKIHLLYCGALFSDVRSPDCFLKILERLDERFCVTFMGRNCEQFWKEHAIETHAQVRVYPPQPYQVAINAMEKADVLINLGNNMGIHMPSKTLDYINAGKPIVSFYNFPDCPTLYYTKRYPLCLNLYAKEFDPERDTSRFVKFCMENRQKRVSRSFIEDHFSECRPETISEEILRQLETILPNRAKGSVLN